MIKKLTFSEFMKKFRPNGIGITIVYTPKKTEIIEFREVICDFCNAEITPKKICNKCNRKDVDFNNAVCNKCRRSGSNENHVYLYRSYGFCERCAINMKKKISA